MQRARATVLIDDNEEVVEDDVEDADAEEEDDSDVLDDLTLDDIIGDVSGLNKGAMRAMIVDSLSSNCLFKVDWGCGRAARLRHSCYQQRASRKERTLD